MLAVVVGLAVWRNEWGLDDGKRIWSMVEGWLLERPWWIVLALVVLPGFPFPVSVLLLLAGSVWSDRPWMAGAVCLGAIALNLSWTYWFAAGWGRKSIEHLLGDMAVRIPDVGKFGHRRLILLLRLTPGMPLFLQNYALGFLRIPFRLYLPLSMLCVAPVSLGFLLGGAGLAKGNLMPLLSGVSLVVLALVIAKMVGEKLKSRVRS